MAMNIKEGIITESELVQSFGSPSQKNLLLKTNSWNINHSNNQHDF